MKTIFTFVGVMVTGLSLLLAQKQSTANQYTVKGVINGLKNEKIYLYYPKGEEFAVDSVVSPDGSFTFKGTLSPEGVGSVRTGQGRNQKVLTFFLQPGTITVQADKDSLGKGSVAGSEANTLWKGHRHDMETLIFTKLQALDKKYTALKPTPEAKLSDSLSKEYSLGIKAQFARADSLSQAFIKSHPNSVVSPYLAMSYYSVEPETEKLPGLYAGLSDAVKESYYGQKMKTLMTDLEKVGIGKTAPAFSMADTTGKQITLASMKGQYVLVDFWASWCGPCRKENPNVVAAYQKFHDKGFEILAVSLDTKKAAWMKAIDADKLTWYHVSDLKGWKSELLQAYVVKAVPTSFLLDKEGKIIAKNLRGDALHKKLAELLKGQ